MTHSMQFANWVIKEYKERGAEAFKTNVEFDEAEVLLACKEFYIRALKLEDIVILKNDEWHDADKTNVCKTAIPGKPSFYFYSIN